MWYLISISYCPFFHFALYLEDCLMDKCNNWDISSMWCKDLPNKMCVGQWPTFHGPVVLSYLEDCYEPSHEIMVLFILRKLILQTRMPSHPVGLDVWFLVGPFNYFHTLCMRTAKALVRLCGWAGSPEPLLVAYVLSTIISWAGSFDGWMLVQCDTYIDLELHM